MLQELSIRNFAIIEDLSIRFDSGLTILSGETGAGKSIIINAVNLLLGSRASASLIRTGAESAELEALFDIVDGSRVAEVMAGLGYDPMDGLLVRRIITRKDRHRIYVNGRLATMQVLTAITVNLASISGQHAHQGLLKEDEHLYILDQFGALLELREQYGQCYQRLVPLIHKQQKLVQQQERQGEKIELLRFQFKEIDDVGPKIGEDEILERDRLRLKNGERLFQTVQQCVNTLYSNDGAVVEQLGHFSKDLAKAGEIDAQLAPRADEMAALAFGVEDLVIQLRDYLSRMDLDSQQLEAVEERLDSLNKLKRKYGGSMEAIQAYQADIGRQLDEIENIDGTIEQVQAELAAEHKQLCCHARELTGQRRQSARQLARHVEQELAALKMAETRFAVELLPLPADREASPYMSDKGQGFSETGMERAAFLLAPNVGEAIKPLASIASGGELSRVVLALKAILAQNDSVETVVFDEVDAGIGGGVAEVVGKKLAALARHHQILCITHLPQIAKYGDHHFRIVKAVSKGRTHTTIAPLSADKRIEEIARMLGGEEITATTLDHARELLTVSTAN